MTTATVEPQNTTASSTDVGMADASSSLSRLPTAEDLVLIPGGFLPREQEYYWSEAWQAGEQESRAELAAGRGVRFDTADDAIRWLLSDDDD